LKKTVRANRNEQGVEEIIRLDNDAQQLGLELLGSDPYLIINKKLLSKFGPARTIFINNLIDKYRYFKNKNQLQDDGSFFLTHEDQKEHTGMSDYQIRSCKTYMVSQGILKTKMKGIPPKEYYYINMEKLLEVGLGIFLKKLEELPPKNLKDYSSKNLTNNKENKYKENKYKENKYILLPKDNDEENNQQNILPNKDDDSSVKNRTKEYLPLASKLADVIKQNKNINTPPQRLHSWSNDIRKLSEQDGVDFPRIEKALDWYQDNIGGEYIPVIESGATLRSKFVKLEDAMKRQGYNSTSTSTSPTQPSNGETPKEILRKHFDKDTRKIFYQDCFIPAKSLFSDNGKVDESRLAHSLVNLYDEIQQQRNKNLSSELKQLLPGPIPIIENYITWIEDNHWITNITPDMFDTGHTLFGRYRREEAKRDNVERDPLTGYSYMRE